MIDYPSMKDAYPSSSEDQVMNEEVEVNDSDDSFSLHSGKKKRKTTKRVPKKKSAKTLKTTERKGSNNTKKSAPK